MCPIVPQWVQALVFFFSKLTSAIRATTSSTSLMSWEVRRISILLETIIHNVVISSTIATRNVRSWSWTSIIYQTRVSKHICANKLSLLLNRIWEHFSNGRHRIHHQNIGPNSIILFFQSSQNLHKLIFHFFFPLP